MPEVILHVGMHKTGSTSVQQSLVGHQDEACMVLPNPIGVPNHSTFLFSLVQSAGRARRGRTRVRSRAGAGVGTDVPPNHAVKMIDPTDAERALERAVRALGARRLVISGEGAMLLSPDELAVLRDRLCAHGLEPRLYAYVRAPVAYATSLFQQHMKNATAPRFDLAARFCDYRDRFEKFDDVFGRERVELRKFDPATFTEHCVVRDFCRWTGVSFRGPVVRANESLNVEVVRLAYVYHRMADAGVVPAADTPTMRRIVRNLAPIEGGRLRFAPALLRPLVQARQDDITWIEQRLGASLAEDFESGRPGDVAGEADLWTFAPSTLAALSGIASRHGLLEPGERREDIARLMAALADMRPAKRTTRVRALAAAAWRRVAG
jgi:hypothetical protein